MIRLATAPWTSRGIASRHPWIPVALIVGLVYLLVGRLFALPPDHVRLWRLAAWIVCGAVFGAQIVSDVLRLRHGPRATALHASAAVAIGALGLALAGMIHSLSIDRTIRPIWIAALVLWPAITAIPAFLVALVAAAVLTRMLRGAHRG